MTPNAPAETAQKPAPIRALVATGPTREPIDAVRYIGNRSSGRMGCAICHALARAGCSVTAAVGPGSAEPQSASRTIKFQTAADLLRVLTAEWPGHDLLVMAAAVADFAPAANAAGRAAGPSAGPNAVPAPAKLKRESGPMTLQLQPTQDILSALTRTTRPDQYVVGFALEAEDDLEASARAKIVKKAADAIVANPLETMDSPTVRGRVLLADGTWHEPADRTALGKDAFAQWLCELILPLAKARREIPVRTL